MEDPDEGRILIDGQDISNCTFESFRKHICIVNDRLEGTIKQNLGSTDETELLEVTDRIGLLGTIDDFDDGFDSDVSLLSSNDRLKISVGHGLKKDAKIYIFEQTPVFSFKSVFINATKIWIGGNSQIKYEEVNGKMS